jgi:hypothetical protein
VLKFRQGSGGSVEVTEMAKLDSLKGLFVGTVDGAAVADLTREIRAAVAAASPSHCFAGLTSWFRTTDQAEQDAVASFFRENLPEFEVLKLSGHEEALKESIAVTFAAEKSGIGKPDTQVAAGGGSMQLVQGSEVYSLEQGFREGQSELMGSQSRRIVCEELEDRAFDRFADFKEKNPAFAVTAGTIVGISAAYYAAKGAKIDCSKGVLASEAHELFKDRKDELVANCSLEEARAPVSDKKVAQEIANVIIFCELFEQLIHPDSEIYFRRNWELDGVPFITTWSAGHFLQHLDGPPIAAQPTATVVSTGSASTSATDPGTELAAADKEALIVVESKRVKHREMVQREVAATSMQTVFRGHMSRRNISQKAEVDRQREEDAQLRMSLETKRVVHREKVQQTATELELAEQAANAQAAEELRQAAVAAQEKEDKLMQEKEEAMRKAEVDRQREEDAQLHTSLETKRVAHREKVQQTATELELAEQAANAQAAEELRQAAVAAQEKEDKLVQEKEEAAAVHIQNRLRSASARRLSATRKAEVDRQREEDAQLRVSLETKRVVHREKVQQTATELELAEQAANAQAAEELRQAAVVAQEKEDKLMQEKEEAMRKAEVDRQREEGVQLHTSLETKRVAHREQIQDVAHQNQALSEASASAKRIEMQETSAVAMQKVYRGHSARATATEEKAMVATQAEHVEMQTTSAVAMQKVYRGHSARATAAEEKAMVATQVAAAKQVQAVARGSSGRKVAAQRRDKNIRDAEQERKKEEQRERERVEKEQEEERERERAEKEHEEQRERERVLKEHEEQRERERVQKEQEEQRERERVLKEQEEQRDRERVLKEQEEQRERERVQKEQEEQCERERVEQEQEEQRQRERAEQEQEEQRQQAEQHEHLQHEKHLAHTQAAECIQSVARGQSARRLSRTVLEEQKIAEHMARAAGGSDFLQRWILKWSPELRLLYIFFVDLEVDGDGRVEVETSLGTCQNTVYGLSQMLQEGCSAIRDGHISVWWERKLLGGGAQRECAIGDDKLVLAGLVNIPHDFEVNYDEPSDGGSFHEVGTTSFDMKEVQALLSQRKSPSPHDFKLQQKVC